MTVESPEGMLKRVGSSLRTRTWSVRNLGIVAATTVLFVFLMIASPVFLTPRNLTNVLEQSVPLGLIAVGGTLLLISGGMDLSVGATFALTGVVAAQTQPVLGTPMALVAGVLVGLVVGLANGLLATYGRINPLVTTLASAIVIRGIALVLTGGFLVSVTDPSFDALGRGDLAGIPVGVILWVVFALVCGFALSRTTYGRRLYAVGGNVEAARLSGIRVNLVRTTTYVISGFAAGLAGVLVASRVSTGQASAGFGMELSVIAAIVVGGTSIWGGDGAVWRTIFGVLFLALIGNGFNLLQVPSTFQQILEGSIILIAVAADSWSRQRRT